MEELTLSAPRRPRPERPWARGVRPAKTEAPAPAPQFHYLDGRRVEHALFLGKGLGDGILGNRRLSGRGVGRNQNIFIPLLLNGRVNE